MPDSTRRNMLKMAAAAAVGNSEYQIIDPHVHVWKHDLAFPFSAGAKVPDFDPTPEALLDLMKANAIAKTVIIQVIHYRYDNSYLAAVLKQYPQYFRGVCRVDPLDPAAPDHLSEISAAAWLSWRAD
jgi:L-fuconolactonase